MNILMISPTPFFADRGCHTRIMEQAKALKKVGHKVIIATYPIGNNIKGLDIRRTVKLPFYKRTGVGSSGKFPFDPKIILDLFLFFKVIKILRSEKIDVIHAHLHEGCFVGYFARLFSFRFKTPMLFDVQGSLSGELTTYGFVKEKSFGYKFIYTIEWLIDRMPEYTIGSSQASIDHLIKVMKVKKTKAQVVGDGASPKILATKYKETDKNKLRKKHGITKKEKVVVYTGALTESKGIDYLLKAIPKVVKKVPDAYFLIFGYPGVEESKEKLKKMGVEKYAYLPGGTPYELLGLYISLGNIGVDPKTGGGKEASGKNLNYMAASTPVVCFDTPNNSIFLGDLGLYAKDGDANDLAKKLVEALKMPHKEIEELGKKLRKKVEEEFSWEATAKKLDDIYLNLV